MAIAMPSQRCGALNFGFFTAKLGKTVTFRKKYTQKETAIWDAEEVSTRAL